MQLEAMIEELDGVGDLVAERRIARVARKALVLHLPNCAAKRGGWSFVGEDCYGPAQQPDCRVGICIRDRFVHCFPGGCEVLGRERAAKILLRYHVVRALQQNLRREVPTKSSV